MRRPVLTALAPLALAGVLLASGCGSQGVEKAQPLTVEGTIPTATGPAVEVPEGDAAAGKQVFASAGCGGCHTLAAAGSSGTVGPNLDDAQPDKALIFARVTNGRGAMPAFKGRLSEKQIADVTAFVFESTHGG